MAEQQETFEIKPEQLKLSLGKLMFLGLLSVILCISFFVSILAPIPLAMAFLLYGGRKATMMGLGIAVMLWGMSFSSEASLQSFASIAGMYTMAFFFAATLSYFLKRRKHPVSVIYQSGGIFLAGILLIAGFSFYATQPSWLGMKAKLTSVIAKQINEIKTAGDFQKRVDEAINQGADEALLQLEMLEKPEVIAESIIQWAPISLFISVFLSLWVCLFVILRNSLLWKASFGYPYTVKDLVKFRVPDWFAYLLIIGLGLTVAGLFKEDLGLGDFELGMQIGTHLLYGVGVFHFFQGFGLYIDFLDHYKIHGFFRLFLMAITFVTAWQIVVIVGAMDIWINFRKYLKSNNEGDNS